MKTMTPRAISILIAFITSLITGITYFILSQSGVESIYMPLLLSILLMFISIYIIVFYMINNFVIRKIRPIYKTIRSLNITDQEIKDKIEDTNIIQDVNSEVISWANKKTKEIERLQEMSQFRKEFIGNVSHELKTPIFNIQGYVLTLLDGALEDEKINRVYLERTEKSINRMISIVEDLEDISKIEAGILELEMTNFNILNLIYDTIEAQEMRAKKKGIKFELVGNLEKEIFVFADRHWITQVITNLIVNSINYGNEYGTTTISFMDMEEHILMEVSDDGIGIEEKELTRIFERFYRIDKSRSRDLGGTGLGLSIVKHILEAHNQTINVQSEVGKGTSFAFTLPKGSKVIK